MGAADFTIFVAMVVVAFVAIYLGKEQLLVSGSIVGGAQAETATSAPASDDEGVVATAINTISGALATVIAFIQPAMDMLCSAWSHFPARGSIENMVRSISPARFVVGASEAAPVPMVVTVLATLIFGLASAFRHQAARVHRLLAPLFSEVSTHGSVHTESAAVTIEGIDEATLPLVLSSLADRDARASFFVSAGDARAVPHLIRLVAAAGHEVGLLAPSGTSSGRLDTEGAMLEAKTTLEAALKTVAGEF